MIAVAGDVVGDVWGRRWEREAVGRREERCRWRCCKLNICELVSEWLIAMDRESWKREREGRESDLGGFGERRRGWSVCCRRLTGSCRNLFEFPFPPLDSKTHKPIGEDKSRNYFRGKKLAVPLQLIPNKNKISYDGNCEENEPTNTIICSMLPYGSVRKNEMSFVLFGSKDKLVLLFFFWRFR